MTNNKIPNNELEEIKSLVDKENPKVQTHLLPFDYKDKAIESKKFGTHKINKAIGLNHISYYGIEIEVELKTKNKGPDIKNALIQLLTSRGNREGIQFYCKHDGSLRNGFELVSNPISVSAWTYYLEHLKRTLKFARKFIAISERAGLHVHASRTSFIDEQHIYRFCKFFTMHKDLTRLMSCRRNEKRFNRYASMESLCRAVIAYEISDQQHANMTGYLYNKYGAIRSTENTIEIRIFKSTVSPVKIIGIIQAIDIIKAYTAKNTDTTTYTIEDFIGWATGVKNKWLKNVWKYGVMYLNKPIKNLLMNKQPTISMNVVKSKPTLNDVLAEWNHISWLIVNNGNAEQTDVYNNSQS